MKIIDLFEYAGGWLDKQAGKGTRNLARQTSRRSVVARLGALVAGGMFLPLLPVARAFAQEMPDEIGDPESCDYWRYCAIGGTLCACCGGTYNSCPPGAEPSPITWIGTCRNPADDKDYLISYNDCCGKQICQRCWCHNAERDRPMYYPSKSSSVLWCFGTESRAYHCTLAGVLGVTTPE